MSLSTCASIPLSHLPLRPSTLQLFQQRGFTSTAEVTKSRKDGGLANLAAELGCSLREATDYVRELQGCLVQQTTTTTLSQRAATHDTMMAMNGDSHTMMEGQEANQVKTVITTKTVPNQL